MGWTRSGNTWAFTSYDELTGVVMNNLAEYGQPVSPYEPGFDHSFVPDFANIVVTLPHIEVMTNGYGKEIRPEHFGIVRRFLDQEFTVPFGSYSFDDLVKMGHAQPGDRRHHGNLYIGTGDGFTAGTVGAAEAAYVHGTVSVALMRDTVFRHEDGRLAVEAFIGAGEDNWDFESSTVPDVINDIVEAIMGPGHNNLEGPIVMKYTGPGKFWRAEREIPKVGPEPGEDDEEYPEPPGEADPPEEEPEEDDGDEPPVPPGPPPGGKHGIHPAPDGREVRMAPGTGREKNTYREELVAVACWKLDNVRFAFGSSFVVPETRQEFRNLATLRKAYPGSPMTVFGHADPTGDDSSNKRLSGERAESIYAVLVHDTARWEKLYVRADGSRGWGRDAIETVLVTLGYPANGVKAFQEANDLRVDGVAGPRTREKLFWEYMKYLWPEKMTPQDFLARGVDKGGKGDFQGCSEFNPAVVFSKAETERFAQAENREERDAENEVNRRVMVLLFRPGFVVPPEKWPCPAVAEGMGGCRRRFWSDGEKRRSPQEERREFRVAQDTFACRFYHRLVKDSPCEGVSTGLVDLTVPLEEDLDADPERPDRVRLRAEEGGYVSVVTVGDPDAVKDGENPLYYYTFRDVPAGFYSIDVKTGGRWRVVLRGLRVDGSGAYWGGRRFVGEVDGAELGTGESGWVADMPEFEEPDYGFR